jgi:hypothetical protein
MGKQSKISRVLSLSSYLFLQAYPAYTRLFLPLFAPGHFPLFEPKLSLLWLVSPASRHHKGELYIDFGPSGQTRSDVIDKEMESDSKKFRKECKILPLDVRFCVPYLHSGMEECLERCSVHYVHGWDVAERCWP